MTDTTAITCDPCEARRQAERAEMHVEGIAWKLNVILAGVASTVALLVALAAWTMARVDQIESRAIAAAKAEAARVAWEVARGP